MSGATLADHARGCLTVEGTNRRLLAWSHGLLDDADVRLSIVNAPSGASRPRIVVSNHRSLFDIPVVLAAYPDPLRMVAKKELFLIPGWGPAMRASGFIEVDRTNSQQAQQSLRQAGEAMKAHQLSLWLAPEGTRSARHEVGPFKKGAFHLAKQTGFSLLPLAISGTERVIPARSISMHRGQRVNASFGEEISPVGHSVDGLVELARTQVEQQLHALER